MKKGFTLVELLAVIIILGIIAVLTIPRIQNVLNTSKEKAYEMLVNDIKDKAYDYMEDNNLTSKITASKPLNVFVYVLISNKYIEVDQLIDPRDEKKSINEFASYVSFTLEDGKIKSEAHLTSEEGSPSDDEFAPIITVLSDNPATFEAGSVYVDAGATAVDNKDGIITSRIVTTGVVNPNIIGSYIIEYTVYDKAGNKATASRIVNIVDNTPPDVSFSMNGNTTWAKTRDITINVTDGSKLDKSSLKYQWTTSVSSPSEGSFTTSFNNGQAISSPAGVTGEYYLWVLAKDTRGNTAIERSNAFRLDNTPPVINIVGDNPINALQGMVYTDPGTTVTEEHSGVNGSVVLTGTLNVNQRGTYNVYYDVSDNAGNEATRVTRTVNVIEAVFTYDYTGSVVPVSLPAGKYKLEVWGAQGGTYNASNNQGGYGGYSVGVYETASATTLYIAVGGQAQTFNGGGTGGGYVTHVGGGATHIATRTGELSTLSSYLSSILIVAGGGGGCGKYVNGGYGVWTGRAGDGGGIQGNLPTNQQYCPYYCSSGGSRGTQSAGGAGGGGSYGTGGAGTFGRGGAAAIYGGWYDTGGGGGGYYGGGGAGGGSAGGGGSGYIGGVVSNATYGITRTMYCYSCTTSTVDGTRTSSTTNVSATATANYAKSGNGYAKITYLGP